MLARLREVRAILRKPADERSLAEKVLISGALTTADHVLSLACRLVSTLIVTRLLAPEIFGLFAIVMTFQTIVYMVTDFGIRSLIIVSEDSKDPEFLRTCWSVQVVRGGFLYLIVLCIALALYGLQQADMLGPGTVYGDPELPAALAVSGFSLVLQALESVNQHVYAKEMRFRLITILNLFRSVAGPFFTILIALFYPTVWALVISGIIVWSARTVLSFRLFSGPSMKFCWNRDHRRELFNRGKWIMSSSMLSVVINSADQLIFGAFMSAQWLGIYTIAKTLFMVPRSLVDKLNGSFSLQFFQEILSERPRAFRAKYYKFRIPVDALSYFSSGFFLVCAPLIIEILYDPRYVNAGFMLQILALGLPLAGSGIIHGAFQAQKRFHTITIFGILQAGAICTGLLVALAIFDSPLAALCVVAFFRVPELVAVMFLAGREGWISLLREIRCSPALALGAVAGWMFNQLSAFGPF